MENEEIFENEYEYEVGSPDPIKQFKAIINAYKEDLKQLSQILRKTTLRDLVNNPEKLNEYEQIIIDVIGNIELLGRSPPGWNFKKSEVIQNLENAQVELGQAQYFLTYRESNPQASAESLKHIHPCRRHLDLAASGMILKKSKT
jgi:hypothetical protein